MSIIDLARDAAADTTPHDDGRKISALWWVLPTFGLWCGLIAWWLG